MNRLSISLLGGFAVLLGAQLLYVAVLSKASYHEPLRLALLGAPGIAALLAAYLAPGRRMSKFLVGLSMAAIGALLGIVSAEIYRSLGFHVDQIGGLAATFLLLLAYNGVASVIGGAIGAALARDQAGPVATETK